MAGQHKGSPQIPDLVPWSRREGWGSPQMPDVVPWSRPICWSILENCHKMLYVVQYREVHPGQGQGSPQMPDLVPWSRVIC